MSQKTRASANGRSKPRPDVAARNRQLKTIPLTKEVLDQAYGLTLLGLTREEAADRMGISAPLWDKWMQESEEFAKSVRDAREIADVEVVQALRRRATGMTVIEQKAILNPVSGSVIVKDLKREIPPSEVAAMMWLSNRHPDKWRWRSNVDITNSDGSFANFREGLKRAGDVLECEYRPIEPKKLKHESGNGSAEAA